MAGRPPGPEKRRGAAPGRRARRCARTSSRRLP